MITVLTLYAIFMLTVAWLSRRDNTFGDFAMASYGVGTFGVGASLFALIGGGELVTLTALSYSFGFAAVALFLGFALSFTFLGIFIGRIRMEAERAGESWFSVPDYMARRIGPIAGWVTFIGSFVAFLAVLILQFVAIGGILGPLTGLSKELLMLYSIGLVTVYLVISGFRSVINTDILQAILMIIILSVIVAAMGASDVLETLRDHEFQTMSLSLWASLVLAGLFGGAASADVWQRALAARSTSTAKKGFIAAAVVLLVYGFLISMIGIEAVAIGVNSPETAFAEVLTNQIPAALVPIAALLLLASIMSTIDTQIFLLSGLVERRFFQMSPLVPAAEGKSSSRMRVSIVFLAVVAATFSLLVGSIVSIYTWLFSVFSVISPFIVMSIFLKLSDRSFAFAVLLNATLFVIGLGINWITLDNLYLLALSGVVIHSAGYYIEQATIRSAG